MPEMGSSTGVSIKLPERESDLTSSQMFKNA